MSDDDHERVRVSDDDEERVRDDDEERVGDDDEAEECLMIMEKRKSV